ncbi:MAG: hypothetical protein NTV88_00805, partial [Candidatus Micrarchaeota archaeon]|nr:hypothetical protein [Candidatus Micrarchaeota archaeon]
MQTNLKPFVNVDGKGALGILSTVAGQKDIRLKKLNASPESEIGLNLLHKDKISLANFAEELFKNIHPKNMGRLPEHVSVSASLNGSLLQIEFKILGGGEDTNFRQCYLSHIANYAKKNGMEFKEGSERAYVLEVQCRPAKEVLTDKLPVDVPKDALTGSKLLEIVRGDKGRHIEIKSLNSGISSDAYGLTIKEFEGFFGKVVNAIEDDGIHVSLVVFRNKDTGGTGISLRSPYGGQFYSALQDKLTTICDEFNVEFYTNDGRFVHQVEFRMPKYGAERKKAQVEALSTEEMLRLIGSICPVTRCDDAARGKEHKI